jgi:hypothetical protein
VIKATTHTGSEVVLRERSLPIGRVGPRSFAILVGMELALLVGVLVWALFTLLPSATPLAATTDIAPVQQAVRERVGGAVHDPLIALSPERSARASNLRGFEHGGAVYYYYVEGGANFDPLSRGAVSRDEIEILLRDSDGPQTFVIYRIL